MKKNEAAKIVAYIGGAFPQEMMKLSEKMAEAMVLAYLAILQDLDYPECERATLAMLSTAKFMPRPAEIRAEVMEQRNGAQRAAGEAWGEVLRAIGRFGAYRSPGVDFEFNDPITARAVEAMGWRSLCISEDQTADRARFMQTYTEIATRSVRDAALPAAARRPELPTGTVKLDKALDIARRALGLPEGKDDDDDDDE